VAMRSAPSTRRSTVRYRSRRDDQRTPMSRRLCYSAAGMPDASSTSPRPAVLFGLMALISAVWGSTWLVIRHGLDDLPPLLGAGLRFVLAGVVMAALVPVLRERGGGEGAPS